jgi:CRP-like cAMP-binding protein
MTAAKHSHETIGNRLLAVLPKKDYRSIAPHLSPVSLDRNQIIHEADKPVRYVYFPTSGVVSILNTMGERMSIEVGNVGKEGMVGINVFWGVDTAPNQAVVQVPGDGVRMKASEFKNAVKKSSSFQSLLNRYTYALMTQTAQSVACNRFHNVEKRFARLLLAICDRVEGEEFQLTQKYISQMLGAHRPHVTTAAGALQSAGLIRYSRGKIFILDCDGLETAACGCYRNGKEKFDCLFGASTS